MPERTLLIKGGIVVSDREVLQGDILISGERISAVGDLGDHKADRIIDADGLLVLPGAVDTHVHFNDVFMNTVSVHDYYTGTLAAAFGGVTSVVDFSNQVPGGSLQKTLSDKHEEADEKALVDWGVHPVITEPNAETLAEIPRMVAEGAPTIKCYMTYREDGLLIEDEDLRRIARLLTQSGGMLMLHAEDNRMIEENIPRLIKEGKVEPIYHARSKPLEVESEAIARVVDMARDTEGKFFVVHLASGDGLDLITGAREEGLDITTETCTHYLVFTEEMLERSDGIKWICSPPLRKQGVQDRLWEGLLDCRIAMVSSDDAAFSWEAKQYGTDRFDKCPNGIPGIEARFHLLYSEGVVKRGMPLQRFVETVSTAPAQLFGLTPQKGNLIPGADADVVLFDPGTEWIMGPDTLHMAADWSAYEGIEIKGKIVQVCSRGEIIVDGEECLAEKGRGRYIHRSLQRQVK
jgi:dihydropyrimidinase